VPYPLPSWVYSQFQAAWQHIWGIFQQYAPNVMFVWNPGDYTDSEWDDPHFYYPGSSYVDWIGIDTFQRATTDTFNIDFEQFCQDFSGIDPETGQPYDKPLMVGANGSQNYSDNPVPCPTTQCPGTELQARYLAGLLADFGGDNHHDNLYPLLKAYDYFDSGVAGGGTNWILDSPVCGGCYPAPPIVEGLQEMAILGATPQFNATPQVCSVSLNPSVVSIASGQAVRFTINVETTSPNCPWSVGASQGPSVITTLPEWVTLESVQSQGQGQNVGPLGPGTVTLIAGAAPSASSPFYVYIGGATLTIQVH